MKRIEVLIPCDLIQDVERALTSTGVEGLTLTSVYRDTGPLNYPRSSEREAVWGTPCCKLDVLVSEEDLPRVHAAMKSVAGISDRLQMVVMDLEATIRIRTGECEEAALG